MEQIYDKIREIAGKYHISKIVLYGSRARGDNRPKSDIDIAVYFLNGYREKESAKFRWDIEDIPTFYEFDVVAVNKNTSERLLANIKEDGVVIYMSERKFDKYKKTVTNIKEAIEDYSENPKSLSRDGLIQRFELAIELAWKTMKDYLHEQGISDGINSPKNVLKKAFLDDIITDEMWFEMLEDRNRTSHIYEDDVASEIADRIVNSYLKLFVDLQEKLENLTD